MQDNMVCGIMEMKNKPLHLFISLIQSGKLFGGRQNKWKLSISDTCERNWG